MSVLRRSSRARASRMASLPPSVAPGVSRTVAKIPAAQSQRRAAKASRRARVEREGSPVTREARSPPRRRARMPERVVVNPVSRPRRVFGIVFPVTSFEATDTSPRARLKRIRRAKTAAPATGPRSERAATPIPMTARAWRIPPSTQTYFLRGRFLTAAAMNNCGRREPDSRMGTRNPTRDAGAPTEVRIQGRTVFALLSSSASLVRVWLAPSLKKFPGTSVHASSGISLQTRASSSSTRKAYKRSAVVSALGPGAVTASPGGGRVAGGECPHRPPEAAARIGVSVPWPGCGIPLRRWSCWQCPVVF